MAEDTLLLNVRKILGVSDAATREAVSREP